MPDCVNLPAAGSARLIQYKLYDCWLVIGGNRNLPRAELRVMRLHVNVRVNDVVSLSHTFQSEGSVSAGMTHSGIDNDVRIASFRQPDVLGRVSNSCPAIVPLASVAVFWLPPESRKWLKRL